MSRRSKIRLKEKDVKLLTQITCAIGRTSDIILAEEYQNTTVEHAKGYLEAIQRHGSARKILLAYFLLRSLDTKN